MKTLVLSNNTQLVYEIVSSYTTDNSLELSFNSDNTINELYNVFLDSTSLEEFLTDASDNLVQYNVFYSLQIARSGLFTAIFKKNSISSQIDQLFIETENNKKYIKEQQFECGKRNALLLDRIYFGNLEKRTISNPPSNTYEYFKFSNSLFSKLIDVQNVTVRISLYVKTISNNINKVGVSFRCGTNSTGTNYHGDKVVAGENKLVIATYENTVPIGNLCSTGLAIYVMLENEANETLEYSILGVDAYVNDIHITEEDAIEIVYDKEGTRTISNVTI